ncbi:MAG: PEGA domain-containing protein [Myxococcaceae bacterium]|nr:PEGA domain-containing protein [Myxococcaceae bacterium]
MITAVPALLTLLTVSAGETWAIADVDAPDVMMGLGAQVTRELLAEAEAQQLKPLSPDQLRGLLPAERYNALKKCRDSAACVAQALSGTPVTRIVTGSLLRDERNYLLRLWHHDVKGGVVVCDVDRAILIAARRFQKDVAQAIPPLLRGEREARGTLVVETNVANAQLSVNGDFVGTPPATLTLKPGKYEVKVEKNKYLPVTRLVAVEANQKTTELVKLLLIPGQTADEDLMPKLTAKKAAEAEQRHGLSLSPPTWISGGVTVAAGVSAAIFGAIARSQSSALLRSLDEPTGVYQGTRAQALEQNRNALIANVSFVTMGVAALATAIFLIIDVLTDDAPATPAPAGGKQP